ncbi:MAG: T9SS type A sorting domain-containing protein [Cytophagales bacterium]|nr:T9SS type A sorting domain-containing protein [Cytophagales bacterium]
MNLTISKNQVLVFVFLFSCAKCIYAQNHIPLHLKQLQTKKNQYHAASIRDQTFRSQYQVHPTSRDLRFAPTGTQYSVAIPIFSENFSSGTLPAGWQNIDNLTGGTWAFNNPGGRTINTPTGGNGFAIFDSDFFGNDGKAEDGDLITPMLDATALQYVMLSFSHYFRSGFGGAAEVFASNDGGNTYASLASWSSSTPNAQSETIDISAIAAGNDSVMIKFKWTGNWSWWWAIDDISIGLPPNFEPQLVSAGLPSLYSMIPVSQAEKINFNGEVKNNGSDTIPNIGVYVDINTGLFSDTIWLTNLAGFTSAAFNSTKPFAPPAIGTYNVDFRIESDSADADTTNNQLTAQFEVSDSVYAWDNDIVNGSTAPGAPLSGFTNIIYGQLYKVTNEDTLTSITFKLWSGTIGQKVTAAVYFTDGNKLPAAEVPLSTTDTLVISSTAQTWYTLPIQGKPIILPPGTYLVGVKEANGATPIGMTLSTTDFVPNSSYIFAEGFGWTKSENFWVGEFIYLIRANFGKTDQIPPLIVDSIITQEAACVTADAFLTVFASGGLGSLMYSIDTGATYQPVGTAYDSLTAGIYQIIIKDSNHCISAIKVINNAGAATISIDSIADVGCYGDSTGIIIVSASGGFPPYEFSIDGAAVWQTNDTFASLWANQYIILVRDSDTCVGSTVISISEPVPLAISMGGIDVSCNGSNDGIVWVTITGGTSPYFYLWNDSLAQLTDTAYNLPQGTYIVWVWDANGCNIIDSIEIFEPTTSLSGVITATDDSTGANVGTAKVVVSGGTPPYTYLWNTTPPQTADSIGGLAPGTYTVTVTDANGCLLIDSVTVNPPTGFIEIINGNGYIKLYPNPTTGKLSIIFDAYVPQPSSIKVLNIIGNIIADITMATGSIKNDYAIDLSNKPEGMYFIQIQTADRVITKKIILNR